MATKTLVFRSQEEHTDQRFQSLRTASKTTKKKFKSSEEDVVGQDSFPFVSPEVLSVKEFLNLDAAAAKKSWAVENQTAVTEEQLEMEKRTLFGNEMEKLEVEVIETNKVLRVRADHNARRKRAEEKSLQLQKTFEERERRTPEVLFPLRHHTVWEGMGVKLSCTFQGCPKPEIKWYKDGVLLQSSSHPGKYKIQSRFGHNTLEISRCTIADSAEYKVVATNKLGEAFSFATVLVNSYQGVQSGYDSTKSTILVSEMEADFDQTLQPSFSREGGSLTLSCEFSSDLLTYQRALLWFKDGVPLPESQRRQLRTGSRSASLTITQVYKEDEGLYSIHLPTLTGVKEQSAYVFVRDAAAAVMGAPGSPLDVECSDINKDYVFLTWKPPSADGGSPVVGYFIDRLDIGSGQWVQCNDAPHKLCRFPVVGLREGGIYQFRVRAVNKAGVGRPSKKTEAVTMVDPSEAERVMVIQLEKGKIVITKDQLEGDILIPLPPTDAHVSEVSGACVVLSWTEPDPRGREPLTYYIEKSVADSNSWQRANLEIPVHSPRFPVFDLTKGKSYCFRVRAVNKYGVSEPSLPSEAASLRETVVVPPPPHGVVSTRNTNTSVVLQWKSPKDFRDIIGYYIYCCEVGTDNWMTVNNKPVTSTRFIVHGLVARKKYVFRIKSVSAAGISDYSEESAPLVVKTAISAPSTPSSIALLSCGKSEMVIGWRAPKWNGGDVIQGYFLDQVDVSESVWHEVNVKPIATQVFKVGNLKEDHLYQFQATAMNCVGVGKASEPSDPFLCKEWTMPEPGPPYGLLYREVRRKSLVLLWEPPVYTGQSPVTGYLVDICEVGSDEWKAVTEEPTSNTFLKVPGLEAGRSYMFRVFAVNAAGVGEPSLPSEEVKAETKPGMKDVQIGVDEDGFIFLEFQTPEWNESSEFLWTKNYSKAIDQGRIRIESKDDRSRLILTNPSEQDLGLYTVAMSDIDDISSSYTFTDKELERLLELSWEIRNPLIALKSNWAVEVSEKGDVRLWLQVEKLSSAAELKLIFNNKEIASTATHKINFDRATGIVEVLIDNFSEVDKGSYTAQIRDGQAKNQFTFVLIDDNFKQALAQSEFKRRDWKRKAGPHFLEFLTWKVTEDCELHFSCKVTNMKKETSLKWFKDGVEVTGVEYNPQTGISTLVVRQVTKKEEGIYKVVLCDERGEDTSVIELVGEGYEKVLRDLSRACALSASPLKIQCTMQGFKLYCSLKYYLDYMKTSWHFKEKRIDGEDRTKTGSSIQKVWIEIFSPTEANKGKYTLEMFDGRETHKRTLDLSGQAFDDALIEYQRLRQADIADKNRARVTKGLPDVVAIMEDKSLCLTCFTSGDPSPEVFWMKNDREIVTGGQYNITKDNVGSTITINTVTTEDSGKYSVFARNKHGSETVSVTVSVYKHGETPKQGEVLI
ncbi:myomesin-3-like [Acipenser ruthenus]|uniref:myomesin-3-like n=1 Tax=Acipenser ruthenus TaxID=7906 RepID=UPI002740F5B2|nr:myomesin-3-like [Acipenser ruthenus]